MTPRHEIFEILLVEDNLADITLVREALKQQSIPCNLHVIQDGAKAIAFLQQPDDSQTPRLDLVLLDMHLPKCDGDEILHALRATVRNARTPVIVMTSSVAPRDRATAERHSALHCFAKPASLDGFMQLGVMVRDVLLKTTIGPDGSYVTGGGTA